jgi:hypothetical protein
MLQLLEMLWISAKNLYMLMPVCLLSRTFRITLTSLSRNFKNGKDLDLHKNIKKINNFKMILDLLIIPLGLLPLLNIKIEGSDYNHTEM